MTRLYRFGVGLAALAFAASCGPIEVRVGKAQGVRQINETFRADINAEGWSCGRAIIAEDNAQTYTVNTQRVEGGCQFIFDQEVEILSEADYRDIKEFTGAAKWANRVEIEIERLDFFDDDGNKLNSSDRVREIRLLVNGEEVLDKEKLGSMPQTVVLQGAGLEAIKQAIRNRQRCTATVQATVTVLDGEVPTGVRGELQAQPTIVLSTAEF